MKGSWTEEQQREMDEDRRKACAHRRDEAVSDDFHLAIYPAFELLAGGVPLIEEDAKDAWLLRWNEAGERVSWVEAAPAFGPDLRMIAMVTSPIWAELGKICLGDSGVDVPPFLPGSVWTWLEIAADELLRLKLLDQKTLDEYVSLHSEPHQLNEGEKEILSAIRQFTPEELEKLLRELSAYP